jgi:hypothetical protein
MIDECDADNESCDHGFSFESQRNARDNISCIASNLALIQEILDADDIKRIVKSNFQKLEQ